MELRNLITFTHVAELGSFTKAAEQLGYSQSTISFQIKQLEEELKIEKSKEENQHKLLDKFKNFKNIYDIGTDEQKKMALRELVDRIIIDTNDNITIELKYIEV